MKHATLVLLLICLSSGSFAFNLNKFGKNASLINIQPGASGKDDVKRILGEPTIFTINNETGKEIWQYKKEDYSGYFNWDNKNNRLEKFSYTPKGKNGKWDQGKAAKFLTGMTTPADVAELLGDLCEMQMSQDDQRLRYTFDENEVVLMFKKGILYRYIVDVKKGS